MLKYNLNSFKKYSHVYNCYVSFNINNIIFVFADGNIFQYIKYIHLTDIDLIGNTENKGDKPVGALMGSRKWVWERARTVPQGSLLWL